MAKISVIVPCYNVSEYLSDTIDSLIKEKDNDIEIVLVNDGSKDNTIDIIKDYEKKYPKLIKVVDQHNMGLSMARNNGVKEATGDYISFIDAEDTIKEGLYKSVLEKISEYDYDMVVFGEDRIFKDRHVYVEAGLEHDCKNKDEIKSIMYNIYPAACNKVYKKELLENVPFKRGVWYEDVEFIYRLLPNLNSIGLIDGHYYNYYQRDNSITYTYNSKLYDLIDNLNSLVKYYKEKKIFDEYYAELEYVYIRYSFATFIKRLAKMKNKEEYNKGVREVMENVKKYFPNYKKNKYLSGKKGMYLKGFNKTFAKLVYMIEKDKMN